MPDFGTITLGALHITDQIEPVGDVAVDILEIATRAVRLAIDEKCAEEGAEVCPLIIGIDGRPPRPITTLTPDTEPSQTRDENEALSFLDHQPVRGRGDAPRLEVVHQVGPRVRVLVGGCDDGAALATGFVGFPSDFIILTADLHRLLVLVPGTDSPSGVGSSQLVADVSDVVWVIRRV